MKALIKRKPQSSYEYTDVPIPTPGPNEVVFKVDRVSICGSDIPLYKWNEVGQKIAALPFIPGHECTGVVCSVLDVFCFCVFVFDQKQLSQIVEVGSNVTDLKVGQRICVDTHLPCENCYQCRHNLKVCVHVFYF